MSMDTKENINWEERRFYTATHIFSGLAANYHHGLIPANYWVKISVIMADELMKILASPDKGTICPELYQRKGLNTYTPSPSTCNKPIHHLFSTPFNVAHL